MVDQQLSKEVDHSFLQRLEGASQSINLVSRAFKHLEQLKTAEIIKAMFILPLEVQKQ